ncbi:MAG: hypothetical protein VKK63_11330 [Synechococcus sp.]|nr:hypothetical protein [Synechococcus sp.]
MTTRALLADPVFAGITRQGLHKRLQQARSLGLVHSPGHGLWAVTAREFLPVTVSVPGEPVIQAVAVADPIPAATTTVTTDSPPAAETILAPALMAGCSGVVHQQVAVNCTVQRDQPDPEKQPPERPPPATAALWSPAELRQLNPWHG